MPLSNPTTSQRKVTMDQALWDQVLDLARRLDSSASEVVRLAVLAMLADHGIEARSNLSDQAKRRSGK